MKKEIVEYYNDLAAKYDVDRFSNSYGNYIHAQELKLLHTYLSKDTINQNLDLACGTGRFLDFAHYGTDISPEMIKISKGKYPEKTLTVGDAEDLSFEQSSFKNVMAFHLFMHLNNEALQKILKEVAGICKSDGLFIFDVPSQKRRSLFGYQSNSWHGGYQISVSKLKVIAGEDWQIENYHGIAFFPIHRIPKKIRHLFIKLDNLLCNSIFKEYSSHLIFVLKRK